MFTVMHTESSMGWGGQENRTLNEAIGLRKLGVRIVILCQPASKLAVRAQENGIEVRMVKMRKSFDLTAIWEIMRVIFEERVDIINTHSGRDSILAGIAGRLSRKKPVIVRTRHLALPITSKLTYSGLPHRVVAVSEYVRQYLISQGIPAERVTTITTGVDLSRFTPEAGAGTLRQELKLDEHALLVGTIAILRIKKGHHVLLEAIPKILEAVPNAIFIFAGDGPQHKNISRAIEEKNLTKHVLLLGLRRDIPKILETIDLFVLPTLEEALGTSFLEAMAMKKPVIGTRVGGVPEVINEGKNGLLVNPGDAAELASAVIHLLKNPALAQSMGEQGRTFATTEFTVDRMCLRMHELYQTLLSVQV
ncbi:MAG: glycosyltransferase family 1 protein [Nitrosomonadales bacterium]|nr:MAG: glycosyltransferase family 1 protein [Nitrosomonadales bacterium]